MKLAFGNLLTGAALGFALSRIGFSSWDEVYRMFTFKDLRLLFVFASAVAVLSVAWWLIARLKLAKWSQKSIHKGTIPGSILFGIGWVLAGACPSIVFVQLGEGQLLALATLGGIFAGNFLYSHTHERFFGWTTTSCVED